MSTTMMLTMQYCSPSPFVCKQGSNCTLICLVSGTEVVKYNWTKDEKPIDADNVFISNNILNFTPHGQKDYGVFVCKAFNGAANVTCSITLTENENEDGEHINF